ncbi:MAG TPA: cytochrome P450 [Streptosporangiaceae bacterium]|nr:cytochrome P450 [Streptosporangiaceae bacterium]
MKPKSVTPSSSVPPGPPLWATPALFRLLVTDRLTLMKSAADRYGDAVRLRIGPKTLFLFNHPDHAKHVLADNADAYHKGIGLHEARRALGDGLLTSEGELWRRQRATIQPAFQHKRIAGQAGVIAEEAARLVTRLRSHQGDGPVDVAHEVTLLALGVLGRTLLSADLGAFENVGHAFEAVQDQAMFDMVSLSMVPAWLPLPRQVRFRLARRQLHRVTDGLVMLDRDPARGAADLVSRLLAAGRLDSDGEARRQRLDDELVTVMLAGHETTASTLSWAFYLIDRHPCVAERLRDEAVEVLGDQLPSQEHLPRLRYTRMVLEEVMRLYPPVWALTRRAQRDDEVGGYHVPAGTDVMICPYTLHRHPAFWDNPEGFDPANFDPDREVRRPRYAYLPFGAGPRSCVGNHLGMMEATFVLALAARDVRLRLLPQRRVVAEGMLSLRIRGGLPMTVHPAA